MKKLNYKQLKTKFLELFNVSHLALDLLDTLEDTDANKAENFILNKLHNELSTNELIEHLGENYILDYYAI